MNKIIYDRQGLRALKAAFPEVTERTIWNALNDVHQSDLAKRIRKRALDMGLKEKGTEKLAKL